jgi:hypothetical protein
LQEGKNFLFAYNAKNIDLNSLAQFYMWIAFLGPLDSVAKVNEKQNQSIFMKDCFYILSLFVSVTIDGLRVGEWIV